jgi:hypothetical protein
MNLPSVVFQDMTPTQEMFQKQFKEQIHQAQMLLFLGFLRTSVVIISLLPTSCNVFICDFAEHERIAEGKISMSSYC